MILIKYIINIWFDFIAIKKQKPVGQDFDHKNRLQRNVERLRGDAETAFVTSMGTLVHSPCKLDSTKYLVI